MVYIAGAHRSGATPLGAILAGNPEIFYGGELYRIPHPIFEVPDLRRGCSCGVPVDSCPFWTEVRTRLGSEPGMLEALREGQLKYERWRSLIPTLWRRARRDPGLLDHISRMGRFVRVLAKTSQSRVVVESSYNPLRGLLYRDPASGLEVRFLHLVRDGRSFLGSERKAEDRPEANWRWLRTTPFIVGRWISYNVLSVVLLELRGPYLRIQYEDVIATPGVVLRKVARFIGVDLSAVVGQVEAHEAIRMRHVAAGNRMRLDGEVRLQHEYSMFPPLPALTRIAFWGLAGWLALGFGYRPTWGRRLDPLPAELTA
jgi:hypothetical protein